MRSCLVRQHIFGDIGELVVLDIAIGNSSTIPIGGEATTNCSDEDQADLVPASLQSYALVSTARLSYFTAIVDEELAIDIHLVEVRRENIDTILGDLHIAITDDGLRLDLCHMILDDIGTKILRTLSETFGPVRHTDEIRSLIVVPNRGLRSQTWLEVSNGSCRSKSLLLKGDLTYGARLT